MSNTSADAISASTSSFITSLAVNSAIAGGELVAFIFVRRWVQAIFAPRTYVPQRKNQARVLGTDVFRPLWQIIMSDPKDILDKNGVDPYVFIRFLTMMSKAFVPIWFISWAILLPVDAANSDVGGKTGLDKLTFGNVARDKQDRYWAHLILDYAFIFWILFLMWREMQHWLVIRQQYLINPSHSRRPQARTVLISGIPPELMDEDRLTKLYGFMPGGVKRVWLARDLKEMPDLHERRAKAAKELEAAQVKLIKLARQHRIDTEAKIAKLQKKNKPIPAELSGPVNSDMLQPKSRGGEQGGAMDPKVLGLADQLVPRSARPTLRLKPSWAPFGLGFMGIGQKVDTIDWARKEIAETSPALERSREQLRQDALSVGTEGDTYPPLASAFIQFNQQIAAHMVAQCLAHNLPFRMSYRYIEQAPENVIWSNLAMNAYEANVRRGLSIAATAGLIVLWTFPVAFIGVLSNVTTLVAKWPWLRWIEGNSFGKKLLQGVISGILPPVLLAVIMLVLPMILRKLAALEGKPSKTTVELDLMTRYFIFLVIHTFVVVTLSSGLISSIAPLANDPASAATILAQQMPTASTFFITLILTQFTGTVGTLLQPVSLVLYYVKVILLGGSPRSNYNIRYKLSTSSWGHQFPGVTVYAVIIIAYCVISPVINGFGACFFLLSMIVYKYLYIWVYDQPAVSDTGGAFFPKAITHVFVGIYFQEVCLCALFFLARNQNGDASAIAQGALMVILIAITIGVHYLIVESYAPLERSLPLSLAHLSYGMPQEGEQSPTTQAQDDRRAPDPDMNTSTEGLIGELKQPLIAAGALFSSEKPWRALASRITPNASLPVSPDFPSSPTMPSSTQGDGVPTSAGPPVQAHELEELNRQSQAVEDAEAGTAEEGEERYFAIPGGPGVMKIHETDGNDPDAFFHPATKEPLRILWLPKDEMGLCEAEIEANARFGIESTHSGAVLNHKGKVRIMRPPPDDFS